MKMSLDVNVEPEEFNTGELHNCIQELAKLKGIDEFDYHVEFACDKHESFVANIFRVIIKESDKGTKLSVIVKTLVNTHRQELFQELHKREVYVYKEVFPVFKKLQDSLPDENRVLIPQSLYSSVEQDKEILILEDLLLNGFAIDGKLAKFENLDYLQVRLVISELAKFHGLSFVLERKDPDNYKKFATELHDLVFDDIFLNKSKLKTYFNDSFKTSITVINDDEARNKLSEVEPKLLNILRNHVKSKIHNVLCHGDCWINNVLFKYQPMKVSQVCFIDFQAMRYANPATDIVYFLYLCTNSEFRQEYFDVFLNVYYDSLKQFLRQYDLDVKHVYSREEFETDVKEAETFGFVMALIDMKLVTSVVDEVDCMWNLRFEKPNEDTSTNENNENSADGKIVKENDVRSYGKTLFSIKINDLVNECVKNGLLDKLLHEINE